MSPRLRLLSSLFSFLLFCFSVNADSNFHTVRLKVLFPSNAACSKYKGFNKPGKVVLPLLDRHGPCSPSLPRRKTPTPIEILHQDQSRAAYLRSRNQKINTYLTSATATIPANSGRSLGTTNFIVIVGLGTPKQSYTLVFDTGSDLTWIQCKPCTICYTQEAPLFDPAKSSTYSSIPCSSPVCSSLKAATGISSKCDSSKCVYNLQYLDQSHSSGYFALETLTLTPSDVFPNFQFGCGQDNEGLFGSTDGLLGLGRSSISLVSQTSGKFAGVFSYCIPSTASSPGYLTFGAVNSNANTKFTALLSSPSLYYLNLTGISVGGQRLTLDSLVFSKSGTVLDSGTVISRLPPVAYDALKSAFKALVSSDYPKAQPHSILDTCYNFSGYDSVTIPKIAFLFGDGVDLEVDGSGILYGISRSQVCLAFARTREDNEIAVIGNRQQRRLGIVHDVGQKRIGFTPNSCN